jgi:KDO2-lipid IV(A) lauroyltransferase
VREATFKDVVEHIGVVGFVRLVRSLPADASVRLGSAMGRLAFDVLGFRRKVVLSNLERHLPEIRSHADRLRLGRASYMGFGMALAEFGRLPLVDDRYLGEKIAADGLDHLDKARRRGKGAILVTGHFGSWELMGCALVRMGYPVDFVVGIQRNPLVQDLMNGLRRGAGIEVIDIHSTHAIVRAIRHNRFLAMLSDQDAGSRGVFVEFLNEQASTAAGAARLAVLTGAPVITGFIIRTANTRHRVVIEPPIYPDPSRDREEEVLRITEAYSRTIEAYVRRYPDHWLWAHRRWKSRPD